MTSSYAWNAFHTLQVDPVKEHHCIGYAPSQGRRCRNPIKRDNTTLAFKLLNDLGSMDPTSSQTETKLDRLASACLCVRNHQDQKMDFVKKWKSIMLSLELEERTPSARTVQTVETQIQRMEDVQTAQPRHIANLEPARPRESGYPASIQMPNRSNVVTRPTTHNRVGDRLTSEYIRRAIQSIEIPSTVEAPISHTERQPRMVSPSHSINRRRVASGTGLRDVAMSSPTSPQTDDRTRIAAAAGSTQLDRHETARNDTISESIPVEAISGMPTMPTSRPCSEIHAARKPLTEHCDICYVQMTTTDALVYCKAECGYNFHIACLRDWLARQALENRRPTCPYCRAPWTAPCEHDRQPPPEPALESAQEEHEEPLNQIEEDDTSYPDVPTEEVSEPQDGTTSAAQPATPPANTGRERYGSPSIRSRLSSLWKDKSPLTTGMAGIVPGMGAGVVMTLAALRLLRKL